MAPKSVRGFMGRLGLSKKAAAEEPPEQKEYPEWKDFAECLTSDARWSTHLSTDKPIYRPGDTIYIRAVLLHPITHAPVSGPNYYMAASIQILSPAGDVVATIHTQQPEHSVAFASWAIPEDQVGGEYTLKLEYSEYGGMRCSPSAERKIQIRNFRTPKLNVRVEFLGRGYGPNDEVKGKVSVTRAEGGVPPAETAVSLAARVDGKAVFSTKAALDKTGVCYASFKLPPEMEEGLGALTAVVRDGGNVESGSKTIPIVLQTLDVKFYPEGGVLVPGFENRVYFEARDPTGEPLELEGEVWQVNGNAPVAVLKGVHEGRGRFAFTPADGQSYEVKITKPSSVKKHIPLPEIEASTSENLPRVFLRVDSREEKDDTAMNEEDDISEGDILVAVGSSEKATLRVTLYKREVALESQDAAITEAGGLERLVFSPPPPEYSGVLRVTVFAESEEKVWTPVAERLIFRTPPRRLHVAVSGPEKDCVPGGQAKIELAITDAVTGEPVSGAVVGVSVVDNSNLEQVEPRRRAPRLPAMALLEDEVEHLEDCPAYINGSDLPGGSDPSLAVDLLLGTQGWRRFLYQDPLAKLKNAPAEEKVKGERFMGVRGVKEYIHRGYESARYRGGLECMRMGAAPGMAPKNELGLCAESDSDDDSCEEADSEEDKDMGDSDELAGAPMGGAAQEEIDDLEGLLGRQDLVDEDAPVMEAPIDFEEPDEDSDEEPEPEPVAKKKKMQILAPVRIYAHKRKSQRRSAQRSDFTETVYFAASLVTDASGKVSAEFDLSDSITSFAVIADAHKEVQLETESETVTTTVTRKTSRGEKTVTNTSNVEPRVMCTSALGASDAVFKIRSVKPFHVDAKCPLELTTDDRVLLPVTLVNAMPSEKLAVSAQVKVQGPISLVATSTGPDAMEVDDKKPNFTLLQRVLGGAKSAREIVPVTAHRTVYSAESDEPTLVQKGSVTVHAAARNVSAMGGHVHRDNVRREFAISAKGFPQEQSVGGMLKPGVKMGGEIALPKDTQPGSVFTSITVFPSPVASLTQALEALIREPYGCFEQTSASVYPNIMAQLYFKTHSGVSPQLVEKSYKLLGTGLDKLRKFEVKSTPGGYDWFGDEPAHEPLTAYALLEFVDMAQVYPVPKDMIEKSRAWLLSRKNDPTRDFQINNRCLDEFGGAPVDISNAYIVWSLTYAKLKDGLGNQIDSLAEQATTNHDPYFVALVAGTLYNVGRSEEAAHLAKGLEKHQKKDGCVYDAKTSITRSGGDSLLIETTAIAALCWLNEKQVFGANIRRAIDWLAMRCKDGKFGSTQATVLALKAIIAYNLAMTLARAPGTVHLLLDGERIESKAFDEKSDGPIKFADTSGRLNVDRRARKMEIEMEGGAEMPYAIQVRYHSEQPDTADKCAFGFSVALQQPAAQEGDLVEVLVTVENKKTDEALPMTVAVVGLPGGLEPRHDQLKELVTRGDVAFYELRGREIIFYWRTLAAQQKVTLRVEAYAAVPGDYVGPASRAYLYYTDELKTWAEPLKTSIAPK